MFLYTGHKACRLPIPPKFLYHGDDGGIDKLMGSMADFARGNQLEYLLLTPDDYYRDLDAKGTHGLTQAMQSSAFQKLYGSTEVAVYKLNSPLRTASLRSAPIAYNHSKCRPAHSFSAASSASSLFAQKKPITIDAVIQQSRENETPAAGVGAGRKAFRLLPRQRSDAVRRRREIGKDAAVARAAGKGRGARSRAGAIRLAESAGERRQPGVDAFRQAVVAERARRPVSVFARHRHLGTAHGHAREPSAIPKLSPDGARVAFRRGHDLYALEIATHPAFAAHRRRQRHAAEWRTGLGLSRRAGSEHGVLVVARFQAHRLHAIRYCARVYLSAGVAHRIARRRRTGTLSASRHRECRRACGRGSAPREAPRAGWIWAKRAVF